MIVGAVQTRSKGEQLDYRWGTTALGIARTINDSVDALWLTIGGADISVRSIDFPPVFALLDSAAAKTLQMSSASRNCRGKVYYDSLFANHAQSAEGGIYPPQPIQIFLPPFPTPKDVRGHRLTVEFDVDEAGEVLGLSFNPTRNPEYNRQIDSELRRFRFRPATRWDGTNIRSKVKLSWELP